MAKHENAVKATPAKKLSAALSSARARHAAFLARRPHRSFRMTRRRDYARSLELPGYFAFTVYVARVLWRHGKTFAMLALVYLVCSILFVSMSSQDTYSDLADAIRTAGTEADLGALAQAGAIFSGTITSSLGGGNVESPQGAAQQIFGILFAGMTWLTTVWLLRNFLAKKPVRLRDGLYSSGAPILATMLLLALLVIQLLPLFIAVIAYAAASASGILQNTVALMLFFSAALLICVLSLYWATTTIIALVVITLPNMYPMQALRLSGDIVVGRRVRILLRFLWMFLTVAVGWALVLIPAILAYEFLKGKVVFLEHIPLIPFLSSLLGVLAVIWMASYVYLLYRKVVDDNADPA